MTWAYDFFIAHAGTDAAYARRLHEALARTHRVFLDAVSLRPGDPWDDVLPRA